jgi:hypothetical protein
MCKETIKMTFCHIIVTFPLLRLSAEQLTMNRNKQMLVQCTIQAKAPDSRSSYIIEAMPNINTVIAMHQFLYHIKRRYKIHIKDVKYYLYIQDHYFI